VTRAWLALALVWLTPPAQAQLLASGDPTHDSAVIWVQTDMPGNYTVEIAEDSSFARTVRRGALALTEDGGRMGQVLADGLSAGRRYHYRIVSVAGPLPNTGTFLTAPAPNEARQLTLLFGADLGGQGYGRIRPGTPLGLDGFPIFAAMARENADLFLALGDMLYSDRPVTAKAPDPGLPTDNDFQIAKPGPGYVANVADFRRDWHYHRSDHRFAAFLGTVPMIATWDDHEIVNDIGVPELTKGPSADEAARDPRLAQADPSKRPLQFNPQLARDARQVMFEYNPIRVLADPSGGFERRLYRNFRWGARAEIIILDTRSYRDPKYRHDTPERPKTMLGTTQKQWLKDTLAASPATWKLIVSSVPLSIPGGNLRDPKGRFYRDSWARGERDNPYGYERELLEIAAFIKERGIRNVLFLTGDQHVSNIIAYDADRDGTVDFHEANIGPLRAGPSQAPKTIDPSLNPQVLFSDIGRATFAYGRVAIAADGNLTIEFRGVDAAPIAGARLSLTPR
jgi:alkaline phosphatase D